MYRWTLKQNSDYSKNPIKVAGGSADTKETCMSEALRYCMVYSSEQFSKMILTIEVKK